ncbi:MAG: BatD family protein [Myxococcales bacterium]|jgi:hypothetical protein
MGPRLAIALLLLLLAPGAALAEVQIDVRTDRRELGIDDRLQLQIKIHSDGAGQPEVQLPELTDFAVLSRQVRKPMQFSFNFGARARIQSSSIYSFVLQPTRVGEIEIGPVRVTLDGQVHESEPVKITVLDGSGATAPAPGDAESQAQGARADDAQAQNAQASARDGMQVDPLAFLRTVVDKPAPYVGEQVTVTVYLYLRQRLQSSPSIEQEPSTEGFWTRDLLPPEYKLQPRRQNVGGAVYWVYVLRRFAAFPLRPGELEIGPMSLTIDNSSVFDIFAGGRGRPDIHREGVPVKIDVAPLPEPGRPDGDVAVGQYQVSARLDRAQTATGDAVALTASVRGRGNVDSVSLDTPAVDGLDVLQPQTKDLVETPNDVVTGTREYRWLIVPRQPGSYTIPPLTLHTFDPRAAQYRTVQSPPLQLQVVGNALPAPAATQPPAGQDTAGGPGDGEGPTPDEESVQWAPIRTRSQLARGRAVITDSPLFGGAMALPPLLWALVAGLGALRRRAASRTLGASERAAREAGQQLEAARRGAREGDASAFHAAAERAIQARLEAQLGESVASLTRRQLAELLDARGLDAAIAEEVTSTLERAEFARFASGAGSAGELRGLAEGLSRLLDSLARFEPRFDPKEAA